MVRIEGVLVATESDGLVVDATMVTQLRLRPTSVDRIRVRVARAHVVLTEERRMSRKRLGLTAIVDDDRKVVGIFTDGDLRRALDRRLDIHKSKMADVMTRGCRWIGPNELAAEAVLMMEKHSINGLLVLDESGNLVGALNVHDLLRAGVM